MNVTDPEVERGDSGDPDWGIILLVLTAAGLIVCACVAATQLAQLKDYFVYIAEYTAANFGSRLILQFWLGIFLYLLFAGLHCRLLIVAVPYNSRAKLFIDHAARAIAAVAPTLAFAFLVLSAAFSTTSVAWVMWIAFLVLVLSAVLQVRIFVTCWQRALKGQTSTRTNRLGLLLMAISIVSASTIYFWMLKDVIGAATFMGGFGVILLFLICISLALLAFGFLRRRRLSIVGWSTFIIVASHVFASKPPEFSHTIAQLSQSKAGSIDRAVHLRGVPSLPKAFNDWIHPRLDRWNHAQREYQLTPTDVRKFPVFIVAAQGGGLYAAYHTALSLARLYDYCPQLKDHVFAISAVSGGSFGSAMFTELLRRSVTPRTECSYAETAPGLLEQSVRSFFSNDFVSPVIASGLFFDFPRLLIPQLRFTNDRARILELAFERAIGASTPFYSSWSPEAGIPALFFNTTSSNYGVPVIISQVFLRERQNFLFETADAKSAEEPLEKKLAEALIANAYNRPSYFNLLEYQPDLELNKSTAAVLSARFPYVTPPGILYRRSREAADVTLRETDGLQLIDGGFWDNSGIGAANEIIRQLKDSDEIKKLMANVEFHLISFGHTRLVLQKGGSRSIQSELTAPIATFEAVREARLFIPSDAKDAGFKAVHAYELFDPEFEAPLSWTLSKRVRQQIEARSGGNVAPSVCCRLKFFPKSMSVWIPNPSSLGPQFEATRSENRDTKFFESVAPNQQEFRTIIDLVNGTADEEDN
ncbi:hypothetical protein AC629_09580 [Bradyrhizobium sp. NAS80.1]|uniref:hypothetical protein n=1 Tax=Bradyrhizobium sp. NAS80.1 TaxID=1680159 RepID=UPI000959F3B8|nr:hypothetical protein [Bradyrhizobium sp. NAS80.1]OKO88533.1 hypothetical protein AC629_09580 [Bradyrhizobium sp. NAS80.1]